MSFRNWLIVRTLVVVAAGVVLLLAGSHPAAAEEGVSGAREAGPLNGVLDSAQAHGGATIQATDRISIPYGFSGSLPLLDDGATVIVSGQGACTAGQSITIAFTVTQSTSGASVADVWNGACTGDIQTWTKTPSATPVPPFAAGEAEACAFAETRADDTVIDTQDWCDDVVLAPYRVFLPEIVSLPQTHAR